MIVKTTKPFVGFCRLAVVDADGLSKRINGCTYQVPIHKSETDHGIEFIADFPHIDLVHFLRITSDPCELLTGIWWHGPPVKPHEHVPDSKILAVLESCHSAKKLATAQEKDGDLVFSAIAHSPFVPRCYSRPLNVGFRVKEIKLQTKVVQVVLGMPKEVFEEWNEYYLTMKEFDKDKKEKDNDDKDSKSQDEAGDD